jgi:integrase/recombinase XerD
MINIFLLAGGVDSDVIEMPLEKAITETIHVKRSTGRRPNYIHGLELYLRHFARGREEKPVHSIGVKEVLEWFNRRNETPMTRVCSLGRLSSFIDLCWRRGYIAANPIDRIDRPYVDRLPARILTLKQVRFALVWTMRNKPDLLAWLVLAMLAGVRPEEAIKITWDNINLERGEVRIDAAASKVRKRRLVPLTLAAVAWLRLANQLGSQLPMTLDAKTRKLRRLRKAMGFAKWPADILRHTAASYLCAVYPTADVADWLGNSVSILRAHYKELVGREDGRRFRCLLPSAAMLNRANANPR